METEEKIFSGQEKESLRQILDAGKLGLSEIEDEEQQFLPEKKKKKEKVKKNRKPKKNKPEKVKKQINPESAAKRLSVITGINGIVYGVWFVFYVACTIMRYAAFSMAMEQMNSSTVPIYKVEVSSPLFAVLRIFAFILPFVIVIWTALIVRADKKKIRLPEKGIIIAVTAADIACAFAAAMDIVSLHMIFI